MAKRNAKCGIPSIAQSTLATYPSFPTHVKKENDKMPTTSYSESQRNCCHSNSQETRPSPCLLVSRLSSCSILVSVLPARPYDVGVHRICMIADSIISSRTALQLLLLLLLLLLSPFVRNVQTLTHVGLQWKKQQQKTAWQKITECKKSS